MAQQWVKVKFPTRRTVYIDGQQSGQTNRILVVGGGTHSFDLGPHKLNYSPRTSTRQVTRTASDAPMVIRFTRTDA